MESSNQCYMVFMSSSALLFQLLQYRLQIYLLSCGSWWLATWTTNGTMASMLRATPGCPQTPNKHNLLATHLWSYLHQSGGFLANTSTPACGFHDTLGAYDRAPNTNTTPPPFFNASIVMSLHHLYLLP